MLYFLLGYFLYGALYAAVGSTVNTQQEAQSLAFPVMMPLVFAVLFFGMVVGSPDSRVSVVLSLIPLLTPVLMFLRISVLTPPAWQIALSVLLMLGSIAVLTWLAGRVYRVGILMYGKRPTFPEMRPLGPRRLALAPPAAPGSRAARNRTATLILTFRSARSPRRRRVARARARLPLLDLSRVLVPVRRPLSVLRVSVSPWLIP